jgi:hypothetical protein
MAEDIVFRIPALELDALLGELAREPGLNTQVARPAGTAGGGDLATVLVELTPAVLGFLGTVVTVWINRPRTTIEMKGMKIRGTAAEVARLLERALDKRRP